MSKRIQDLTPPPTRWRKAIWGWVSKPFYSLSANQRFWLGFGFLCIFTTLLLNNPIWRASGDTVYHEGDIARESIISPADIYFVDDEETNRIRETARESVRPIFSSEPKRADEAVQSFRTAWESVERKAAAANANRSNSSNGNSVNRSNSSSRTESPVGTGSDLARVLRSGSSVQRNWKPS